MVSGAVIWDQTNCQHPQQQIEGVGSSLRRGDKLLFKLTPLIVQQS